MKQRLRALALLTPAPFILTGCSESIQNAGYNTLLGMGMAFLVLIIIAVVIVCRIIYLKYNDVYNEDLLKEFIPEKLRPKKAKKVETETPEAVNGFLKISNTRSIRPEFSNAAAEADRHRGVNRKNENGNSDPSNK